MPYDFDRVIERRSTNSIKWNWYDADVLPLWVADMDFMIPEPVIHALHAKVDQGMFGYELGSPVLLDVVCARMERLYGWKVSPEQIVIVPGIVTGINLLARAICTPGDGVLSQPPVYPPFLHVSDGLSAQIAPLTLVRHGKTLHYEIDFDAFESAITDATRLFLLCNPHNPTGQVFTRDELTRMAEICQRHNMIIGADEIHSELLLGNSQHIPIATLSPEIADRTITFISASKTFNLAGLFCSFAIIPNNELRAKFKKACEGLVAVNSMGLAASFAAFSEGDAWLAQLRDYLTANRTALVEYITEQFPDLYTTVPDATYLAWLDCRTLIARGAVTNPAQAFFLQEAKVGLSDGAPFGAGGDGFVRLNFGCPRSLLMDALQRMTTKVRQTSDKS